MAMEGVVEDQTSIDYDMFDASLSDDKDNAITDNNENEVIKMEEDTLDQNHNNEPDESQKMKEDNPDLEEGECTSDEEEAPAPEPVAALPPPSVKSTDSERRHKHGRSRSRERYKSPKKRKKNKKRDELKEVLSEEEQKKRAVLKRLKALEANMGIYDQYYSGEEEEEGGNMSGTEEESDSGGGDSAGSVSPGGRREQGRKRVKRRGEGGKNKRRKAGRREGKESRKESSVCNLFMQGKCQKLAKDCHYSHDVEPPQVWELCKFYLFDRCAKRDKCLYLHKGFPCKYFHTGTKCPDDKESCKFSHEPLNDTTRTLLLKHLESAPKEILGDFPRMSRSEAANVIFQTEANNKGWITEGPDAVLPPQVEDNQEQAEGEEEEEDELVQEKQSDNIAPSHIKLDPIQEKLLKQSQLSSSGGVRSSPGWGDGPPLAVQQAMAMTGRGAEQQLGGVQGHGVRQNNGAFNNQGPLRRQTVGLLGPPPDQIEQVPPPPAHSWPPQFGGQKKPADLMGITFDEKEVEGFLAKQRKVMEAAKALSEEEDIGRGGDETPECTPPVSRENTPTPDEQEDFDDNVPKLPKAQMALYNRIQQKQKERRASAGGLDDEDQENQDNNDNDWYSDEEDNKEVLSNVLKNLDTNKSINDSVPPPFPLSGLNLPPELTNVLTAINQKGGNIKTEVIDRPTNTRKTDPRRDKQTDRDIEAERERERDRRLMDLDIGAVFGDLELPPLTSENDKVSDQEKSVSEALGLPFKAHIFQEVAKEIDASIRSHPPIDWILQPIKVSKPDYSSIKHNFSPVQLEADPRLRRFAKTGLNKIKELPLPDFTTPKTDPRLQSRKDNVVKVIEDRRRSSEDSEGGKVYNPAKELSKRQAKEKEEEEAYSPGQYSPHYNPASDIESRMDGEGDDEPYDPGYDEPANYEAHEGYPPPNDGYTPTNDGYPPPFPGHGPPPGSNHWQEDFQGPPPDMVGGPPPFQRWEGGPPNMGPPPDQRFPPNFGPPGGPGGFPPRGGGGPGGFPQRGGGRGPMDNPPYFDGPPNRGNYGPGQNQGGPWKGGPRRQHQGNFNNHGNHPNGPRGGDFRGGNGNFRGGPGFFHQNRKKDPRRRD